MMSDPKQPVFKTPADGQYFFGYYDKSAVDGSGRRLLAQKSAFIDRMPGEDDTLELGYFDLDDDRRAFRSFSLTRAWNWQQGCMLQWLGPDHSSKVIYNDRIDGSFVSVIHDLHSAEQRVLDMAIYSVSNCGGKALCIDNERLSWFRGGYSYVGVRNPKKRKNLDVEDGIWLLDLHTNELERIVRLGDLLDIDRLKSMDGSIHYLEHIAFSPNGRRFQFLHRWIMPEGGIYTRLYVAEVDGTNIRLLNDSGRVTHCCWRDDDTILGWGARKNTLNLMRRSKKISRFVVTPLMPLYRALAGGNSITGNTRLSQMVTGDSYLSINISDGSTEKVLPGRLNRDGHPAVFRSDRNRFVTDTYASADGKLDLYLCDIGGSEVILLDSLTSIKEYDGTVVRCDLHPKLSYDERTVAVDTLNDGYRSIYLYEI